MAWFRRGSEADGIPVSSFPKEDAGSASLNDFAYNLRPRNGRVTIRLADSDPHQEALAALVDVVDLQTAGGRRTAEEERTDSPMEVRLFANSRITDVVGMVPRGFESVITETLTRLEDAGRKPRIPVRIVSTRHGLRVDLLLGATR